ncbi:HDIG domain-containing metalloprotein [Desulfosporosinus sp.]|uniref:HD family phosphohydrolase n=1 Tax=Desulfosporosinus sp. TaxID=157907 RepID=UPI0025B92E2B|nr:HDIG domain-containing metalloprotein [Desulfosporosinus sp.]MBC2721056.1 HDIG domain-containing protein [Desulfosporosinus sp.]MBC2725622.1 HDIG domain-containing protein [Desulfosporosinus sp.]
MMVLKNKLLKTIWDELSGHLDWLKHHTTWLRAIVGVMYFLLFTILLSSNIFVSTLQLEVGEPSPQLITAPWTKDIVDQVKYNREKEAAAKGVKPIYKADEEYLALLTKELGNAFAALRENSASEDERISELKKTRLFASLPEGVLTSLIETLPDELDKSEKVGRDIILTRARDLDIGSRTSKDVAVFRDRIKAELDQSDLTQDAKVFFKVFMDLEVSQPTLIVDESTTEAVRAAKRAEIKQEVLHYKANQKIVGAGEIVDETIYQVLVDYGLINSQNTWKAASGIALIVLIGIASIAAYLYQYKRDVFLLANRLVLIGLIMILVVAIGRAVIALNLGADFNTLSGMLIPVAWATMTVAILVGVDIAIMVSVVLAVFVAVLVDPALSTSFSLHAGVVALFGGIVGVYSVSRLSQRSDLARAGIFVSGVNVLMISGIALSSDMRLAVWGVGVILGIVNGLASSFLTVGALHWFESGFHITSSVRLLELSDPNRPLLKRLLMEAPGTYHHSILVGNLAEAAAEAVRADATLVRVASMYHDIGKLKRPYFFIENQFTQDNPHDKIAPTLSSLIITSHVKDGLELAKENKLPLQIQDIIAQHHGDSLVSFFYHKALEENENVPEETFHYEGPKPQTKEAALVALADNVEAAVRSMKQPTPGRVEGFVRKIIKDKLNDGQLDQCDLTFQDLDRIAMAFVRVLSGIFHSRVEYPEMPSIRESSSNDSVNKKPSEEVEESETAQTKKQPDSPEGAAEAKVSQED